VNNNPTGDVTVKILRNDLQKETKKKYRIYIVGREARSRAGRRKNTVKVIARSDNPASVQLNVMKWFMLYSCPVVPEDLP
jgi:hypothetical protein